MFVKNGLNRRYESILTMVSRTTGEILLSLSLFGRDSATGRRPQRFVSEERHSVSEDGTYTLSPTSSIDMNDCLTDTSGLVDVPGSPSLRV